MPWRILKRTFSSVFFSSKGRSVPCASISCGFWFNRILISEALFTFPIQRVMEELIHSMISSRFHVKGSFTSLQQEIIALLCLILRLHTGQPKTSSLKSRYKISDQAQHILTEQILLNIKCKCFLMLVTIEQGYTIETRTKDEWFFSSEITDGLVLIFFDRSKKHLTTPPV